MNIEDITDGLFDEEGVSSFKEDEEGDDDVDYADDSDMPEEDIKSDEKSGPPRLSPRLWPKEPAFNAPIERGSSRLAKGDKDKTAGKNPQ